MLNMIRMCVCVCVADKQQLIKVISTLPESCEEHRR
jgi:hypothetical protein